jgi:hypothetical protein
MSLIQTTGNYHTDLATAKAEGLFTTGRKPPKALLYAGIERHNNEAGAPESSNAQSEPGIIYLDPEAQVLAAVAALEADDEPVTVREAEPAPIYALPPAPAVANPAESEQLDALSDYGADVAAGLITQEEAIAAVYGPVDLAALEEAGDEEAIQAALLAMDQQAAQAAHSLAPVRATARAREAGGKKSPDQILEELELLCSDVAERGVKTIAALMGTSVSRLNKRIKAYQLLMGEEDIFNAFRAEQISYSALQEAAVRRDGLSQLRAKLTA